MTDPTLAATVIQLKAIIEADTISPEQTKQIGQALLLVADELIKTNEAVAKLTKAVRPTESKKIAGRV